MTILSVIVVGQQPLSMKLGKNLGKVQMTLLGERLNLLSVRGRAIIQRVAIEHGVRPIVALSATPKVFVVLHDLEMNGGESSHNLHDFDTCPSVLCRFFSLHKLLCILECFPNEGFKLIPQVLGYIP